MKPNTETHIYGIKARGRKELIKHLKGGRLTLKAAVLAKCFDCMGGYQGGKIDCKMPDCSLYAWMSYREGRK